MLIDLREKTTQITFEQILALSPKLRKELDKLASTKESKKKKKNVTVENRSTKHEHRIEKSSELCSATTVNE